MQHYKKPLAGMVICGSGPNLSYELKALSQKQVFLIQIFSIVLPIQIIDFSHSHYRRIQALLIIKIIQLPSSSDLDNLFPSLTWPKSFSPFYWPMRSQQVSLVCVPSSEPATILLRWIFSRARSDETSHRL